MNFTQLEFPIFLCVVTAIAWACPSVRFRNSWLLLVSYYFYAYWDWRFCGLLIVSTAIDFSVSRRIDASDDPTARKRWLWLSVVANLGMLGFFKYFNFFIDSARPLLTAMGVSDGSDGEPWQIILPVGISFFTFQTMSYTIDVYRRKIPASDRWLDFALYVAFFPQLVAGPIVRAANFLPQLIERPAWSRRRFYGGLQQILRGAVKKILIADRLGETVDVVFAGPELYSSATIWLAVIAYAGQIYYDFSGYSDMAIGVAKLLGYRFPVNFRHPYLSTSISDFWRRWHITLSSWLRDYLYVPLGGSRGSKFQNARNLMVTMTLGGLWHGAATHFVVWGIWHGIALVVNRFCQPMTKRIDRASESVGDQKFGPRVGKAIFGWAVTMSVVLIGWVWFRASSWDLAMSVFSKMAGISATGIDWFPPLTFLAIVAMILDHSFWSTRWRRFQRLPWDWWFSPVATTVLIWSLLLFGPRGHRPFVYFQF